MYQDKSWEMKLKIGYWLGNANPDYGGISPHAWRVLEMILSQSSSQNLYILILGSPDVKKNCIELINKYKATAKIYTIQTKVMLVNSGINQFANLISKFLVKANLPSKWLKYLNPFFYWFASLDIDFLHVPYQTAPQYDLPYPLVVTMHDVQELHYPEFFTPEERANRAEHYWRALKHSSAVIVSYDHVKKDLIKYFHLPDSKVYVCPIPYDQISLQSPSDEEARIYQQEYAYWDIFVLYPAQTWQHKNHLSLIKAVQLLKEKCNRIIHLVCTGKKNPEFFPVIENYLKKSEIAHQVHFLDIVSEPELYWLYKNCSLVVIPTLYEAGSFPLLEAMSLQAPVICSSVTSLPETIGDTRFVFDPLDIEKMASLIIELLDDSELRATNIVNGKQRIKKLIKIDSFPYFIKAWKSMINRCNSSTP